jgi:signal transduction histidine kinase
LKSVLHKILLSSLLVILLPVGVASLWTSNTFTTLLERRFAEKSNAQAERIRLLLAEKEEIATGLVNWIAEMPGVKEQIRQKDRDGLFQHLLPLVSSVEMDFIEVLDKEGRIFLRVHNPSRYGDRPTLGKDVQGLLRGLRNLPNYGIEERAGRLFLRAVESIEEGGVLGAVSAGYVLGSDFVRKLERAADGEVLITIGDRLYLAEDPLTSAVRIPDPVQKTINRPVSHWHRDNPSPSLEIRLPLETLKGTEGIISVFFPLLEMKTAIGALQRTLLLVALVGTALAFSVSWILSRRITRPLKELVRATEDVASGNFAGIVRTDSGDEIGALAVFFARMVEELRKSKAEVESYRQELERKFIERGKELAETEAKRAAMAHMIAHDLKNPLLGITKTLERLDHPEVTTREQRRKIVKDLVSAGNLVMGMVNEMLDLYRSDFGEIPLSLTSFLLEEPIQTSLRVLAPELEERRIRVVSRSDPPYVALVADKRRLTRLLINILSNAIKFSPDHAHIYVSTAVLNGDGGEAAHLLVRVEDEGTGIPDGELSRIFDRFYSRDQGQVETGTGLGLPYCKLVAEAHQGQIWAENRESGGLVVSVILPTRTVEVREAYVA